MVPTNRGRRPVRAGLLAWLLAAGGCATPQFDALRRELEVDPRERIRIYESCRARSDTTEAMDRCMTSEGYRFVSASDQDYQASECWDDRYQDTLPKAYCWDKVPPGKP